MGEPTTNEKPGIYFLQTNAQSPFAIPHNKTSDMDDDTVPKIYFT